MLLNDATIDFTSDTLRILVVCLIVFIIADLFAAEATQSIWANYINLVLMIIWLTAGLPAAMLVLVAGLLVTTGVRLLPKRGRFIRYSLATKTLHTGFGTPRHERNFTPDCRRDL